MPIRLNDIESAFRLAAEQGLKALDLIAQKSAAGTKELNKLDKASTDTAKSIQKIGVGLSTFGASLSTALGFAVAGAERENESLRQLEGTVNSTGQSFDKNRARILSFVDGLATATKFSDDEIVPAFNRAVVATNDIDKAMRATELGVKLAAAGFGTLQGNAALVAKVLDGQVRALGRVIPEFSDLEERIEAGASEADLAAEALGRLERIASSIKPPSGLQQLSGQIGELKDAIGNAVIGALEPLLPALTKAVEFLVKFAETGLGKVVIGGSAFAAILATIGGALLIFAGQVVIASTAISGPGGATIALAKLTGGLASLGNLLLTSGPVLAGIAALAIFVGKAVIELNKLSKASDEARDKAFQAPRIAQFTAELNVLRSTIDDLRDGTISASEAQKEFDRFGVAGIDAAEQRVEALGRIIARLKDEKKASDDLAKANEDRAKSKAEKDRVDAVIIELEREKQKRIELDILQEQFAEKELERGKKLAGQVKPIELPPLEPGPLEPLQVQNQEPIDIGLKELNADADIFIEKTGTLEERVTALAEKELDAAAGGEAMRRSLEVAAEQAAAFEGQLIGLVAGALDGLAQLGANFAVDLVDSFSEAGKNAQRFFANLGKQLLNAIAKALILQSIIGAIGGGSGIGRLLGGLFQDAHADQLARFEGQRFVDLFFQGVTREFSNTRDQVDLALADNRDVVAERGNPISVVVNEASPETTVEFTDRLVEPRVRARARQRSTRGDLTGSEIDRAIDGLQGA